MKNIYKYTFILILLCLGTSCSFLEVEPQDKIAKDNYYKNQQEAYLALTGAYATLRNSYTEDFSIWFNMGTDEMLYKKNNFGREISKMSYNASDSDLKRIWKNTYQGINRINDLIESLSELDTIPELTERNHNLMLGEGYALRALHYFNLVRVWEHVPLQLDHFSDIEGNFDRLNYPNTPAPQIYAQIVKDLEKALELLEDRPKEYGRISKQIVHGLLARVYLTMAGVRIQGGDLGKTVCYQRVVKHTTAITDYGYHGLLPSYKEVFMNEIQGFRNDTEVMWEVDFTVSDERNLGGKIGNFNGIEIPFTTGSMPFSTAFAYIAPSMHTSLYVIEDERLGWNCADFSFSYSDEAYQVKSINNQLRWYPGKWRRLDKGMNHKGELDGSAEMLENGVVKKDLTSTNFPLLRFSDVLLMRAEANYMLNGDNEQSRTDIQTVRDRANAGDLSNALTASNNDFMTLIQDERKRELCFEGHRRFDLVRWGILQSKMQEVSENVRNNDNFREKNEIQLALPGERVEEKHVVFPIPADELQLNVNINQHPLW